MHQTRANVVLAYVRDDLMLQGVLFDSGGTLIGPVGGRWNPRLDFEEVVLRYASDFAVSAFTKAFAVGDGLLASGEVIPNSDDYHRALLAELGVDATESLLADLG